jgi:hypothetical protein
MVLIGLSQQAMRRARGLNASPVVDDQRRRRDERAY